MDSRREYQEHQFSYNLELAESRTLFATCAYPP